MAYWSDERTSALSRLWKTGQSASSIARILGDTTRNAVTGKAWRLGLIKGKDAASQARSSGAISFQSQQRAKRNAKKKNKPKTVHNVLGGLNYGGPDRPEPDFPTFEPDLFIPESKRKGLIDLEPTDCHWPIGDPVEIGFHFCGKVKIMGKPYCEFHCNRAYLAPSVSRVRSFEPVESETIQDQPSVKVGAELIDG